MSNIILFGESLEIGSKVAERGLSDIPRFDQIKRVFTSLVGSEWNLKWAQRDLMQFMSKLNFSPDTFTKVYRKRSAGLESAIAGLNQSVLLRKNMLGTGGAPTICETKFVSNLVNLPHDYVLESFVYYAAIRGGFEICRPKINFGEKVFGNSHWQNGLSAKISLMRNVVTGSRSWR